MLERPSGDSVEMACEFVKEAGAFLQDVAPQGLHRCVYGCTCTSVRVLAFFCALVFECT